MATNSLTPSPLSPVGLWLAWSLGNGGSDTMIFKAELERALCHLLCPTDCPFLKIRALGYGIWWPEATVLEELQGGLLISGPSGACPSAILARCRAWEWRSLLRCASSSPSHPSPTVPLLTSWPTASVHNAQNDDHFPLLKRSVLVIQK